MKAEKVLREKQRELVADLARLKGEAREAGEVRDVTDQAAADEGSGEALEEVTLKSRTLEQVEDALKRVADGTYGKCVICGRAIPAAGGDSVDALLPGRSGEVRSGGVRI